MTVKPWLTGEIFDGHFEVGHLIARGGMAEVYHGIDLWSNNPVAIKVLSPQLAADPSQQQKFFREERSLRQISHEHVVSVLGSGTEKICGLDLMFLVLDYVHGCTLQQLLTVRPVLSVQETLDIVLPVVEGLSEVHAHRLIHRDIKPSNILLSSEERSIKLTDFGLTRRQDQSWTGELMGTPAYVAPEIVDPQASVGPGVDIFAMGIVMFRMLCGRLPFSGSGDDQRIIYHNVNTEIPSIARFAPGVDSDLVGVIKWCTRKQTSARPADATELFEVLLDIRRKLSPAELAYRADDLVANHRPMWDDVEEIAEKSGANEVLRRGSISAFAVADDVMDDELLEAQDYEPVQISGVGPEPKHLKDFESEFEYFESETDRTMLDGDLTATAKSLASSAPAQPVFEPISASYRGSHGSQRAENMDEPSSSTNDERDIASYDPRQPAHAWVSAPTPVALVLTFLLLLVGVVTAGFVGWELAQAVLRSGWFATYLDFVERIRGFFS